MCVYVYIFVHVCVSFLSFLSLVEYFQYELLVYRLKLVNCQLTPVVIIHALSCSSRYVSTTAPLLACDKKIKFKDPVKSKY